MTMRSTASWVSGLGGITGRDHLVRLFPHIEEEQALGGLEAVTSQTARAAGGTGTQSLDSQTSTVDKSCWPCGSRAAAKRAHKGSLGKLCRAGQLASSLAIYKSASIINRNGEVIRTKRRGRHATERSAQQRALVKRWGHCTNTMVAACAEGSGPVEFQPG